LWGVNGATSVCASVVSAIIAVVAGISAAYWTGVVCYFIAIVAISVVKLRTPQRAENALVA
jgi:nicotinamide mononucleotide (NMN) deamidase PncC